MQEGVVKFFNFTKGFGFITMDNGEDVFFHKSGVEKHPTEVDDYGYPKLAFRIDEGVRVKFNVTDGQKGPMAVDVKLVEGAEGGEDVDIENMDVE